MDLFCKSMDSNQFEGHKSGLKKIQFVLLITNPDLKIFGDHESSQLTKDSTCFQESNKFSWILITIAQNESLKIKICKSRILTNPDPKN